MFFDENRVERPVKVDAGADMGSFDGLYGVDDCSRADRKPGVAQRASKIGNVFR